MGHNSQRYTVGLYQVSTAGAQLSQLVETAIRPGLPTCPVPMIRSADLRGRGVDVS